MVDKNQPEEVGTSSIDREAATDRTADPDEELRGRRPGDDPFLPEEGFFWWLPRALSMAVILLALILLAGATLHHGKYRLARTDEGDMAVLERGRFRPWGWAPFIPDGALEAWAPVAWPESVETSLEGEVRVLADAFLGFIRSQAAESRDDRAVLGQLEAQEAALETWYLGRWKGQEPPQDNSIASLRAGWSDEARLAEEEEERLLREAEEHRREREAAEAEAAAAALAAAEAESEIDAALDQPSALPVAEPAAPVTEVELARARVYASDRRAVLRGAEDLLGRLPSSKGGTGLDERDRRALQAFIEAMDTPVLPTPRPTPVTATPVVTPQPAASPTPTPLGSPASEATPAL